MAVAAYFVINGTKMVGNYLFSSFIEDVKREYYGGMPPGYYAHAKIPLKKEHDEEEQRFIEKQIYVLTEASTEEKLAYWDVVTPPKITSYLPPKYFSTKDFTCHEEKIINTTTFGQYLCIRSHEKDGVYNAIGENTWRDESSQFIGSFFSDHTHTQSISALDKGAGDVLFLVNIEEMLKSKKFTGYKALEDFFQTTPYFLKELKRATFFTEEKTPVYLNATRNSKFEWEWEWESTK